MTKEIYIKREPSIKKITADEAMQLMGSIPEPNAEMKRLEGFLQNVGMSLEDLFNGNVANGFYAYSLAIDWNGCRDFWTCEQDEKGMTMVSHPIKGESIRNTIEDEQVLKDYVNLDDFIRNGAYIGRFFRRTHLVYPEDKEFLPVNHGIFVLYANDGTLLSAKNNAGNPAFEVIPRRYTADGKYEYYGNEKILYDSPKQVHKAIIKQLTNTNRNTQ